MKKVSPLLITLIALTLALAACGAPAAAPPTSAPTAAPPTAAPTEAAGTMVAVGKSDALGSFLVDDKGMTLYLFTKDTPNTSNCYDKCAKSWPPLLTSAAPVAGAGLEASRVGTTQRTDGTMQVTYNGWPLYYYAKDAKAGDTTGQNVGEVWFVISPAGEKVEAAATQPPTTGGSMVNVGKNDALGSFLVDDKGMTLYLFTKDTPNTSACYDKCATNWPPLLSTDAPVAGEGVDASKLGTTQRKDGTMQVTYNGWPLYYYAKDAKAGDTTGQTVGDVWFVISPAGEQIQ